LPAGPIIATQPRPAGPKLPGRFAVTGARLVVYAGVPGIAFKLAPWMPRGA